jgi:rSAM/selenodomain-associated transferase 2
MRLAIVVPMLNEESVIATTLRTLRKGAPQAEIIVVDGGSQDQSVALARPAADQVIAGQRGRARQMNAGARAATTADTVAFVHADTLVPQGFARAIELSLDDPAVVGGRFDLKLDASSWPYRVLGWLISLRSRLMRSATGDQAIFVRRAAFPGFPEIALMEDIAFSRSMKRLSPPACLSERVLTSGRRWERDGIIRTLLLMWRLRLAYFLGASPDELARRYAKQA